MRWRQAVLGLVAWLVVVAVGSTLVWAVIARTGDRLVSSEPLVTTTTPAPEPTGSRPATVSPRPTTSPSSPQESRTPSTSPAPVVTPSPTPPQTPPPAPASVSRSWQGEGGLLTARCRGAAISLVAAQPDAGFAVDVAERGPGQLVVAFNGREDSAGKGSRVTAICASGAPSFHASPTGGDDNGGGGGHDD